ncbi:MAG: NAD-dependent DNA ligase LigA [Anaerolineaceae bacterium]
MDNSSHQDYIRLINEINSYNYYYHVLDQSIISDAEFDSLIRKLRAIESQNPGWITNDSPTQRVGAVPVSKFGKVNHPLPILSLANAFNEKDLIDWRERIFKLDPRVKSTGYVIEPKIDGLTVVLHYQNGQFVLGATRGNGEVGEDITSNIRTIRSIPMTIPIDKTSKRTVPSNVVVRGEVYISIPDFETLNDELLKNGEKIYLNPRNTAAGSLRQLDPKITSKRPLKLLAYSIVISNSTEFTSQWEILKFLRDVGFPVSDLSVYCKTFEDVLVEVKKLAAKRDDINFEIDGLVIKIDDLDLANDLGFVGKDPRGAIALKFPAREEITTMVDIGVNVGRTGVLTPFAILEPVEIGGVIVKQATLHNFDYILEKDIRIGDRVLVKRAGDVIPYIIGPILETRKGSEKVFSPPLICPVCGQETEKLADEVARYCVNSGCPAQLVRNIEYFVSRSAMDIVGMGIKIVEILVKENVVKDVADLYSLTVSDLLPLEGFAQKKAENLVNAIQTSKQQPLSRLITALGIRGVGEVMASELTKYFHDLDELSQTPEEILMSIEGIGPNIARQLVDWFQKDTNKHLLMKLKENGVWPIEVSSSKKSESQSLSGLTFVVTGTLENFSRDSVKEYIEANGGKVTGSVSKSTNLVLVGENPGSKVDKAIELNIKIIRENDLTTMVNKP